MESIVNQAMVVVFNLNTDVCAAVQLLYISSGASLNIASKEFHAETKMMRHIFKSWETSVCNVLSKQQSLNQQFNCFVLV